MMEVFSSDIGENLFSYLLAGSADTFPTIRVRVGFRAPTIPSFLASYPKSGKTRAHRDL